jgi:proteasome accessory factor C
MEERSMANPRLEASDKVTLLMSFVPYLIEQGPVAIDKLAQHFDISAVQVEELVQLLAMSGIPGDDGFYQHQDLFDINWDLFEEQHIVELWQHVAVDTTPRFSAREAAALLAGLQYISGIVPDRDKNIVEDLVNKISSGASAAPENLLVTPAAVPVDFGIFREAANSRHSVHFAYRNAQGVQLQRSVDPLRLDLVGETWYLRGWCHEREALRTFRLDRITDISVSEAEFLTDLNESDLSDELFDIKDTDLRVRFIVEESALSLLSAYRPEILSAHGDGGVEVEVAFGDLSSVSVFAAQVPGAITVVSPPEAISIVHEWAQRALDSYSA